MSFAEESPPFQLSGSMTLYESSEVRERLMAALTEARATRFNLETAGPWDLAGLQLLISLVASGRKLGIDVRFVLVPRMCVEVADRAGLSGWLAEASESFW